MKLRRRTFALAELAHIQTVPLADHLHDLREDWDAAKVSPITLRQPFGGGKLTVIDGNHRLTLARERGDAVIEAIVQEPRHCRE